MTIKLQHVNTLHQHLNHYNWHLTRNKTKRQYIVSRNINQAIGRTMENCAGHRPPKTREGRKQISIRGRS